MSDIAQRTCSGATSACAPAPLRFGAYLPDLLDWVLSGAFDPRKVFDLTLPVSEVTEAYTAMDERRAIKTMLMP